MKNRFLSALIVGWLCSCASASDNSRRAGVDIETETALDDAVREFNAQVARISRIGREEPPLSSDELIASIQAWDIEKIRVDPKLLAVFQKIAETRTLPKGSRLDFTTGWERGDGLHFTVWSVDISLTAPNPSKDGSFVGYTYRLRDRKLSSRRIEPKARVSSENKERTFTTEEIQRHVARHYESIGFINADSKN